MGGDVDATRQPLVAGTIEEPIFALAVDCGRLFEKNLDNQDRPETANASGMVREYQRLFWKWSQYVGVFAVDKASLDWRLRRNNRYRELFLLALDMLRANLQQLLPPDARSVTSDESDSSDESDTSAAIFDGIKESISQLNSLGISIRRPTTSRLESKVHAFGAKHILQLNDFELKAVLALERLYPYAASSLQHRLVRHMVGIHARLLYWDSHAKKLGTQRGLQTTFRVQNYPSEPKPPVIVDKDQSWTHDLTRARHDQSQPSAYSATEATTVPSQYPAEPLFNVKKTRGGPVSTFMTSRMDFPPPPKAENGHECWYCHKVHLGTDYESDIWWRNHTNGDLLPFVCLFDNCLGPKIFSSSGRWVEHMACEHGSDWAVNIHDSLIWRCDNTGSAHQEILHFRTFESLEDHFVTAHRTDVELGMPGKTTERTISNTPRVACPFCYMNLDMGVTGNSQTIPTKEEKQPASTFRSSSRVANTGARVKFTDDVEATLNTRIGDEPANLVTSSNDTFIKIKTALSSHIAEHLQRLAFLAVRLNAVVKEDGGESDLDSLASAPDTAISAGTRSTIQLLNEDVVYEEDEYAPNSHHGAILINQIAKLDDLSHWETHEKLTQEQKEMYFDTLVNMVNLASTFKDQGHWREAEAQENCVLKTRQRILGEEHPDTLAAMTNLASTYLNQGRLKKDEGLDLQSHEEDDGFKNAIKLLEHVVAIRKSTLDEGHPDRLASQSELARAYEAVGQVHDVESTERTMWPPQNSTDLSLEDQITARLVENHFPLGWRQKYMPLRCLNGLVTRSSIIHEFLKDDEPGEDYGSQVRIDEGLIDFIVNSGQKLFAISLIIGIESRKLHQVMKVFQSSNCTDEMLPVTSRDTTFPWPQLKWGVLKMENFTKEQWKFVVPIIDHDGSHLQCSNRQILPFRLVDQQRREGAFSNVWQVEIHEEQQRQPMRMFDGSGRLATAAIKEFKLPADMHRTSEAADLWEREAEALKDVNGLRHRHIIEMKAIITWEGKGNYFMFQWADGGSLRDFYERLPRPTLNATFIKQVLLQLTGLSSALNELHNYKKDDLDNCSYRHGDLKPENILRFNNGTEVGLLKMADLGLAKLHLSETGKRGPTVTRHGTPLYEPPEVILEPEIARSRQYDVWSMGCVLLELLVWLTYGNDELVRFNDSMNSALGNSSVYWVMEETDGRSRSASVHPSVVTCMDIMGEDLQRAGQTAVVDLLQLVRNRLLVVRLPQKTQSSSFGRSNSSQPAPPDCRAKAADLENDMQQILNRAQHDDTYASTSIRAYDLVSRIEATRSGTILRSRFSMNVPVVRRQGPVSIEVFQTAPELAQRDAARMPWTIAQRVLK